MSARDGSPLRMMLILSAIDLLSSALIAGLVLFVILVGGDAGRTQASSTQMGSALNLVTLVDQSGQTTLFKQSNELESTRPPTDLERAFFGNEGRTLRHRRYFVPADSRRLLVISGATRFEIRVQPATGESISIFVNCSLEGGRFELELTPLVLPACRSGEPTGKATLMPGRILLLPESIQLPNLPKRSNDVAGFARYVLAAQTEIPGAIPLWAVVP